MAIRYAFDLYPRLDPRDGSVIRRFEHLQEAAYKAEENGTGSGLFTIHGGSADAEDIDPLGLDYVRVIEIDNEDDERVVGGFFLDSGDYEALTRKETRKLTLKGAGTLSYLQRSVMWSRSYINNVMPGFIGQDPIGTTWNLAAQSTFYANGNHLGAMLWRVISEAQSFRSGSYLHRHFDGTNHTGTHSDDRTESAIPDLIMTFDQFEDSDGNDWLLTAGTFSAQVGESVLDVVRRLMEMGLKVQMDPDTFELHAWEAPHRTDRTSGSWAANKVRFQKPTAENLQTGNIKSDTDRKVRAHIQRSVVLAGSDNSYAISQGSTEPPWEGGYRLDTDETTTPGTVASRQRLARSDAVDNVKLVFKLGDDELDGYYRPWDHVSPGDLVTLHTGTDQWEYNETTFPVAAIVVELKQGGDWRAIAELGSSFTSLLEPAFAAAGAPGHTHPPNPQLCIAGVSDDFAHIESLGAASDGLGTNHDAVVVTGPRVEWVQLTLARSVAPGMCIVVICGHSHNLDPATAVYDDAGNTYALAGEYHRGSGGDQPRALIYYSNITDGLSVGDKITFEIDVGSSLVTSNETDDRVISAQLFRGSLNSPVESGNAEGFNSAPSVAVGGSSGLLVAAGIAKSPGTDTHTPDADWTAFDQTGTSGTSPSTVFGGFRINDAGGETWASTISQSRDWAMVGATFVTSSGSVSGDGPPELIGSSPRASRCDHNHLVETLLTEETDTGLRLAPDGSGGLSWEAGGSVTLSDDTPLVESGTGDPGVSDEVSRSDHVHPDDGGGGGGATYFSRRVLAIGSNANAAAIDVNSTAYVDVFSTVFYHDWGMFPATHFMITAAAQSNAAGQTISVQLAEFGAATNPLSAAGNDLVITNTFGLFSSGWVAISDTMAGIDQLVLALKGSNSTVDLVARWMDIAFKIDP